MSGTPEDEGPAVAYVRAAAGHSVHAEFDDAATVPPLRTMLRRGEDAFELTEHTGGGTVRATCLGSPIGTGFGDRLVSSGEPVGIPLPPEGSAVDPLGRILDGASDGGGPRPLLPLFADPPPMRSVRGPDGILLTGVTVLDFLAPIPRGGSACVAGPRATGKSSLVWPLLELSGLGHAVVATTMRTRVGDLGDFLDEGLGGLESTAHTFVVASGDMPEPLQSRAPLAALAVAEHMRSAEGADTLLVVDGAFGEAGAQLMAEGRFFERAASADGSLTLICTAVTGAGQDPSEAASALSGSFDAVIATTSSLSSLAVFPAVDVVESTSAALDPAVVGSRHYDAAMAVRELLERAREAQEIVLMLGEDALSPEMLTTKRRADMAETLLEQPSLHFEGITGRTGQHRDVKAAVALFERLLRGELDGWGAAKLREAIAP